MNYIIIANIVALIGSIFMILANYASDEKRCVLLQSIQIFMFIISNILLRGITGIIINTLSLIRNILTYKQKFNTYIKYFILLLIVILSIIFNNLGIIGYLPLTGTVVFTIFIDSKNNYLFRLSLSFSVLAWLIYDIYIMSYTSAIFDFLSIIGGIIAIIKLKKKSY